MKKTPVENAFIHETADTPLIVTRDLSVYCGAVQALNSISLEVPERLVTAFIGPSGCGKSTLLRSFNRMNELIDQVKTTGEVSIAGHDIYAPSINVVQLRKKVGMVFQKSNPFPKTIRENIVYGLRLHGTRNKEKLNQALSLAYDLQPSGMKSKIVSTRARSLFLEDNSNGSASLERLPFSLRSC
jgi:ABC-type phosphate transport system ATPase subunit